MLLVLAERSMACPCIRLSDIRCSACSAVWHWLQCGTTRVQLWASRSFWGIAADNVSCRASTAPYAKPACACFWRLLSWE